MNKLKKLSLMAVVFNATAMLYFMICYMEVLAKNLSENITYSGFNLFNLFM